MEATNDRSGIPHASQPMPHRLIQFLLEGHDRLRCSLEEVALLVASIGSTQLRTALALLRETILEHFSKEEQLLFPLVLDGQGRLAAGPIRSLEHEHQDALAVLASLPEIVAHLKIARPSQRSALAVLDGRLESLTVEFRDHVRLENQVLFRMALGD